MPQETWFLLDLGNTVIRLGYERVLANICRSASIRRDALVNLLEEPGGYRDLERGAITFRELHDFLADRAGYRGTIGDLREIWSDFFEGTVPGIEELLDRIRQRYRLAFVSNSNEVHADVIPRRFGGLFEKEDRFLFSHRIRAAKPDPEFFRRALETLGALPAQTIFIDDLRENVLSARALGIQSYQFEDVPSLTAQLERDQLL
jgi:putative hydrolase of the HAD superfamily